MEKKLGPMGDELRGAEEGLGPGEDDNEGKNVVSGTIGLDDEDDDADDEDDDDKVEGFAIKKSVCLFGPVGRCGVANEIGVRGGSGVSGRRSLTSSMFSCGAFLYGFGV